MVTKRYKNNYCLLDCEGIYIKGGVTCWWYHKELKPSKTEKDGKTPLPKRCKECINDEKIEKEFIAAYRPGTLYGLAKRKNIKRI